MIIGLVLSKTPSYSETFFISKIKGLQSSGFEVVLFVQQKGSDFSLCEVKLSPKVNKRHPVLQFLKTVVILKLLLLRSPKRFFKFIRLERQSGRSWSQTIKNSYTNAHILRAALDWLHFGFATMALQSEHVAAAINAKMAVSLRGFDIDVFPLKHETPYALLWKRVDKVHSISTYLLSKAYSLGLSPSTSFQIITPAVDVTAIPVRQKVDHPVIQLITVGRLHWIKGLTGILEALALVKEQGIPFTYTLIGDGAEFQNLKFAVHQLGLSEVVVFAGTLTHEATLDLLSASDLYIQYSHSEGFCNAVLEAQAMGLLCVVSDGGALAENIIDGETGWVVPKRSSKLLAKRIIEVIKLPKEQKELIRNKAIHRINKQFNLNKQEIEFRRFYE